MFHGFINNLKLKLFFNLKYILSEFRQEYIKCLYLNNIISHFI